MLSAINSLSEEELKRIEAKKKKDLELAQLSQQRQESINQNAQSLMTPDRDEVQQAVLQSADQSAADIYGAQKEKDSRWRGTGGLGFAIAPVLNMFRKDQTKEFTDEKFESLTQARKIAQQGEKRANLTKSLASANRNQEVIDQENRANLRNDGKRELISFEHPDNQDKPLNFYYNGRDFTTTDGKLVDPKMIAGLKLLNNTGVSPTVDEKNYNATTPLKKGTPEYQAGFSTFLSDKSAGVDKLPASGVQLYNLWKSVNLNASDEEKKDMVNNLISNYKTFEQQGVVRSVANPTVSLGGDSVTAASDSEISYEGQLAAIKERSKLDEQALAKDKLSLRDSEKMSSDIKALVASDDFDGSVGFFDAITGRIGQIFETDEGIAGRTAEMLANNLVLNQAQYFKGNLNETEILILQDSVPKRSDGDDIWRRWFEKYSDKLKIAQDKYMTDRLARRSGDSENDIIWID